MKVFDEVWVMESNKPTKKIIFSISEKMCIETESTGSFKRLGTQTIYSLISIGAFNDKSLDKTHIENKSKCYTSKKVFVSKKELIESLYNL